MKRRWSEIPRRGGAVDLPAVRALASGSDPGTSPVRLLRESRVFIHYRRTRFYLDRDAWESLPANGVLVMRVEPQPGDHLTFAFTLSELEDVFGEVRDSRSWGDVRCYHFPELPPAARSFLVGPGVTPQVKGSHRSASKDAAVQSQHSPVPRDPWASDWYSRTKTSPESAAYLDRIDQWRRAWRPDRVRILLVAESHVAECPGDLDARVHLPAPVPEVLPDGYCRLVYCLGYGEDEACRPRPEVRNAGTIPFWDLFGAIVGNVGHQPRSSTGAEFRTRLAWKLDVLRRLRSGGVWLADASVVGIYSPGGERRFTGSNLQQLLRESFTGFVWPEFSASPPEQVWVIGRGVGEALAGLPGIDPRHVISQPGDHDVARYRDDLARMVAAIRG